jgi:hypothetical protein
VRKNPVEWGILRRASLASLCAFQKQEGAPVMVTKVLLAGSLLVLPSLALAQRPEQRLETGVFFTFVRLAEIGSTDHGSGTSTAGLGGRVVWRLLGHVDVDGELALHPNAGVSGHRVQGFLGAKAGLRLSRVGLFAKVRPGFVYFSKDPFGVARPDSTVFHPRWAHSLEPALDLGGVLEYYGSNGLVIRFDLADTIVSYDERAVSSSPLEPPRQVAGFTTRNRQWSLGVGKRF